MPALIRRDKAGAEIIRLVVRFARNSRDVHDELRLRAKFTVYKREAK